MRISQEIFDLMRPMPPFIYELRQANRKGEKSQTRRVMKPQPKHGLKKGVLDAHWYDTDVECQAHVGKFIKCRYGKTDDVVYMREPLVIGDGGYAFYKDDGSPVLHAITGFHVQWEWKVKTLSQLYMPKFAARSIFRYVDIRVERLQEITFESIAEEGVIWALSSKNGKAFREVNDLAIERAKIIKRGYAWGVMANKWDAINAERGFGWNVNPWVWVLRYVGGE